MQNKFFGGKEMRFDVKKDGMFILDVNEERIDDSFEDIDIVVNRIKTFLKSRFP